MQHLTDFKFSSLGFVGWELAQWLSEQSQSKNPRNKVSSFVPFGGSTGRKWPTINRYHLIDRSIPKIWEFGGSEIIRKLS